MGQTYSFYTDDETGEMLTEMSAEDRRSVSNFLTVLIRAERAAREQKAREMEASRQPKLFEEQTPGTGEVQNG